MDNVARNLEVPRNVTFDDFLCAACFVRDIETVLPRQFDAATEPLSQLRRRNEDQAREEVRVEFNEAVFSFRNEFLDDGLPRLDVIEVDFVPQTWVQNAMRELMCKAESIAIGPIQVDILVDANLAQVFRYEGNDVELRL